MKHTNQIFMCRKGKFNFIYKIFTVLLAAISLVLLSFNSFAQDLPCQDQDPTGTYCPLDNWVWLLVIAAAIFASIRLNRRQQLITHRDLD
jgi:hypothetical protein